MPDDEPVPLLVPIVAGAVPFAGSALVSPVPFAPFADDGLAVVSLGDVVAELGFEGAEVVDVVDGS